ncbi:MAG: CapA family protein [Nanoarchaeota archaeon]
MIFCGDFVYPSGNLNADFSTLDKSFLNKPKALNFEAAIDSAIKSKKTRGIALKSTMEVIEILEKLNVKCTSHANNHTFDFKLDIKGYKQILLNNNILPMGFGENIEEASRPFVFDEEKIVILSFGWKGIGCKYARKNNPGVNPYKYSWVESQVKFWKNQYPNYKLILFIHWNYELEKYPQPADREFSRYMVKNGVDAIFGHHPHIIQGYEFINGKPIFYSLGNFYLPQIQYGNKSVSYPKEALKGVCCEYVSGNNVNVYLIRQDREGRHLEILDYDKPDKIKELTSVSGFQGLSKEEYFHFFKKNRLHKRKFLPIYKDYTKTLTNKFYDGLILVRQYLIDTVVSMLKN